MVNWNAVFCFAGVQPHVLKRLDETAHTHTYQAGSTIFNEGERCAGFHVVVEGLVRIYRISSEGRLHTLSLLRPPAAFNEVAAVDGGSNPYNAVAVTQAVVAKINHASLMELLSHEPDVLRNYVQALAHVNREYIERLEDMTFRSIPSRLAKLFLHETTYADQIAETPTRLNQEDIASILGTTREVVGC
jgi:CRP-like cAMP-binding protein